MRSDDVHLGVELRPVHRGHHVRLRRQVEHRLGRRRPGERVGADVAPRGGSRPASTFSRLPVARLSTTCTSSPRASSASTTCEPMKPAPPVTIARTSRIVVRRVRDLRRARRIGQDDAGVLLREELEARGPRGRHARAGRHAARRGDPPAPPPRADMSFWAEAALFAAARAELAAAGDPARRSPAATRCSATATSTPRSSTRESRAGSGSSAVLELNLPSSTGSLPDRTFCSCSTPSTPRRGAASHRTGSSARATASARRSPTATGARRALSRAGRAARRLLSADELAARLRETSMFRTAASSRGGEAPPARGARATARRTRTSSTARPASASSAWRLRSPPSCSATAGASSAARIPTSTCSSRSATRSASTTIRRLRRDLHMRPFEAIARVYLLVSADLLNEDAADALLKDLEEPPEYAVDRPRRRRPRPAVGDDPLALPARPVPPPVGDAVHDGLAARAPGLPGLARAFARVAGGRLDRADRLLDPSCGARREDAARARARRLCRPGVRARGAARPRSTGMRRARGRRGSRPRRASRRSTCPAGRRDQRLRRAAFGAEREERARGARGARGLVPRPRRRRGRRRGAVVHVDQLRSCARTRPAERMPGAERAAELVRESWRWFEELNLEPRLALEALFVGSAGSWRRPLTRAWPDVVRRVSGRCRADVARA